MIYSYSAGGLNWQSSPGSSSSLLPRLSPLEPRISPFFTPICPAARHVSTCFPINAEICIAIVAAASFEFSPICALLTSVLSTSRTLLGSIFSSKISNNASLHGWWWVCFVGKWHAFSEFVLTVNRPRLIVHALGDTLQKVYNLFLVLGLGDFHFVHHDPGLFAFPRDTFFRPRCFLDRGDL